jgi:hypothetical protein
VSEGSIDPIIVRLIELGGPAAVMWYVLVRLEARLREVTDSIDRLTLQLALLLDRSNRSVDQLGHVTDHLREQVARAAPVPFQEIPPFQGPSEARERKP